MIFEKCNSMCNNSSASTPTRWLAKGEWLTRIRSRDLLYAIASHSATCKRGSPVGLDRLWKRAKEQSGNICAKVAVTYEPPPPLIPRTADRLQACSSDLTC